MKLLILVLVICVKLIANVYQALAQSQCMLPEDFVRYKNFTLFVDGSLMRTPVVDSGQTINSICNLDEPVIESTCTDHGVFTPSLPTAWCTSPMSTTIYENTNDRKCKAPATLYQVGYSNGNRFNELYSSCYNQNTMEAIYVENNVYSRPFEGKRPECEFVLNDIISFNDAISYRKDKVYLRFCELLGSGQRFISHPNMKLIDRGHLAPASDFVFVRNKCATFKYINVVPQFASINGGNWILVEDYSRSFRNGKTINKVITGTIGVLELPHASIPNKMVKMYLLDGKNPIPKYVYKIVNSDIFVNYNNPFATTLPNDLPCDPIKCPNIVKNPGDSLTNFNAGYIFCCERINL